MSESLGLLFIFALAFAAGWIARDDLEVSRRERVAMRRLDRVLAERDAPAGGDADASAPRAMDTPPGDTP